ncbi:MAG: nucleotide exchange factor GrpE [Gemmatimonadales bacterium]
MEPVEGAVQRLEAELAEGRDRHLRLAAEFDNFRKRTARERGELTERAQGDLLARLLDPIDDLDRLATGGARSQSVEQLHEAVLLTEKKFWKELEAAGLETIDPVGAPFDPSFHEAISSIPAPDAGQAHRVAQTFQIGYRLKGLLLRPARVQVYGDPVQG